jgi:glutaminyl-tRNA synthetase
MREGKGNFSFPRVHVLFLATTGSAQPHYSKVEMSSFDDLDAWGLGKGSGNFKQIEGSKTLADGVRAAIAASGLDASTANKTIGNLLYSAATSLTDARANRRDFVARYIGDGRIKSNTQLTGAVDYLKKRTPDADLDVAEFERSCGVGVAYTEGQVKEHVAGILASVAEELSSARYLYPLFTLLAKAKEGEWRWADGKTVKDAVDAGVLVALGPKTAEDEAKEAAARAGPSAKKAATAAAAPKAAKEAAGPKKEVIVPAGASGGGEAGASASAGAVAGQVESVFAARELEAAVNSAALIAAHVAVTGGVIRTRFPPEPNGYLHIGHAKSMNLNFEGAFKALGLPPGGGTTIFRYDDTNPDAETKEYIDNMAENVAWMGWKPCKTTHSSDYFGELYELAKRLIIKGSAYVCHQTKDEMEASREISKARDGRNPNSPWRDRPVAENMAEFEAMRAGKYAEGKAVLRMKIDMHAANPTLWDPVAYRIKYTPHPHAGDAWCIYPSYDYSHALIDSLEHIDYSLCTLEFEVRRDLYYWVLEQLDMWRPHVWEFARMNITHVQLSKRKILKLVNDKAVRGWDDPRLPTIIGLRRRGYTAGSINAFCRDIGVTRNYNIALYSKLEFHVREWRQRRPRAV